MLSDLICFLSQASSHIVSGVFHYFLEWSLTYYGLPKPPKVYSFCNPLVGFLSYLFDYPTLSQSIWCEESPIIYARCMLHIQRAIMANVNHHQTIERRNAQNASKLGSLTHTTSKCWFCRHIPTYSYQVSSFNSRALQLSHWAQFQIISFTVISKQSWQASTSSHYPLRSIVTKQQY